MPRRTMMYQWKIAFNVLAALHAYYENQQWKVRSLSPSPHTPEPPHLQAPRLQAPAPASVRLQCMR
jgi:hypothetical protein